MAMSMAEVEYYAASKAAAEVKYLLNLLARMGLAQKARTPENKDNNACIEWGNRERAKHMDIRKRFAHAAIHDSSMRLVRAPTALQLAVILTRGLHLPQWQACVAGIQGAAGLLRDPQGRGRHGYLVTSRRPLTGMCRRLGEQRPWPDVDLNPDYPGLPRVA